MGTVENVINAWRQAGVVLYPGANRESLGRLEIALGVALPDDVVAYFSTMNGMDDSQTAEWLSSFWSIEKILSQRLEREGRDTAGPYKELAFADVLINSWFFWFRVRPGGRLSIFVEGSDEEQPSLTAAFDSYTALSEGWKWRT
jgi:hypothetical protein